MKPGDNIKPAPLVEGEAKPAVAAGLVVQRMRQPEASSVRLPVRAVMHGNCVDCLWWEKLRTNPERGYCHYNPPKLMMAQGDKHPQTYWPSTRQTDHCHQFEPRAAGEVTP